MRVVLTFVRVRCRKVHCCVITSVRNNVKSFKTLIACNIMRASSKCRTTAFLSENVSSRELTALANVRLPFLYFQMPDSMGQHPSESLLAVPLIYHAVITDSIVNARKETKMLYEIILAILACCGAALVLAITIFAIVGIIITGYSIVEYAIKERKNK